MRGQRGITLIELLVAVAISILLVGAIYQTYISLFRGARTVSETEESFLERQLSVELIRLDIEHAGYGIAYDEPNLPLVWNDAGKTLTIRSVLNSIAELGSPWAVANCSSGGCSFVINPYGLSQTETLIFLSADTKSFVAQDTLNNLSGVSGVLLAIRYDGAPSGGCSTQDCYLIEYSLSNNRLPSCHPSTRNLVRTVNGGSASPLISCVSDFKVTFDLDTDGDGFVDSFDSTTIPDVNGDSVIDRSDLETAIKRVNVYVAFHEGEKDPSFSFSPSSGCSSYSNCIIYGNVELELPSSDYQNYRWRVLKISVKPKNIGG